MRLAILGLVIALLIAWIGVAIRPWYKKLSNFMLLVAGGILFLLVGGFAGWFIFNGGAGG